MGKINFKELNIYTDISREHTIQVDARKEFANAIYMGSNGIVAHNLAFRILNSSDELEVSKEEEAIIIDTAKMCKPVFYDSLMHVLNSEEKQPE